MPPTDVFTEFTDGFRRRKFTAGLLVAMIDLLDELRVPSDKKIKSFEQFLQRFPRQEYTAGGRRANTLIVERPDGATVSLRPFYNRIEEHFRDEEKRFDYPSCAPHATQAWSDYRNWWDTLCQMNSIQLKRLRKLVVDFVLSELPSQAFDPASVVVEPPLFRLILEEFNFAATKGEPTGAAFQGAIFGFLRADNPHLQVEIRKVRVGSRRKGGVGDVDAWDGDRLAITAEVKHFHVAVEDLAGIAGFVNEALRRNAIGLVVAQSFGDDARAALRANGLSALDIDDLIEIVSIWDPAKQRIAATSLMYYVVHVEKNSILAERLKVFLSTISNSPSDGEAQDDAT